MMAAIGRRNSVPEVVLRRALRARGLRYRLHDRGLPARPTSCFADSEQCAPRLLLGPSHRCPYTTTPGTREEFWQAMFRANVARDSGNQEDLLKSGWSVVVAWECALRGQARAQTACEVDQWLRGSDHTFESVLLEAAGHCDHSDSST